MLSKQTIERIEQEADDFGFQVPYNGTNDFYNMDKVNSYKAGATAEATRHEQERKELVEALEKCELWVTNCNENANILHEIKATLLKHKTQ